MSLLMLAGPAEGYAQATPDSIRTLDDYVRPALAGTLIPGMFSALYMTLSLPTRPVSTQQDIDVQDLITPLKDFHLVAAPIIILGSTIGVTTTTLNTEQVLRNCLILHTVCYGMGVAAGRFTSGGALVAFLYDISIPFITAGVAYKTDWNVIEKENGWTVLPTFQSNDHSWRVGLFISF